MFSSNVKDEIPEEIKRKEDEESSKYDENDNKKIYNMDKSQKKKQKIIGRKERFVLILLN